MAILALQCEVYDALGGDVDGAFMDLTSYMEVLPGDVSSWLKFSRSSLQHGNSEWKNYYENMALGLVKHIAKTGKQDFVARAKAALGSSSNVTPKFHLLKMHPI